MQPRDQPAELFEVGRVLVLELLDSCSGCPGQLTKGTVHGRVQALLLTHGSIVASPSVDLTAMPSRTSGPSRHELEVLDHGTRLITAPMPARASVSVALMFRVGSRFEAEQFAGISHFVEHMVFKGTERYPSARAVAEAIEGVGGVMNASTDKELTMYWTRVPSDKLEVAIDVLGEMVRRPLLEASEVEKERDVIIEELRMYLDSPSDHVHTLFEEIVWPGHPLGLDVAGTEESLREIGRKELEGHVRENYLGSNLVAVMAGDIGPERSRELMAPLAADMGDAERPGFKPALPPPASTEVRLMPKATEQAHIVLGGRCSSYLDADRYCVDLMNIVLGEGMSSRLFLEIREQRSLCYDVHSWLSKLSDTGAAGIYIGTEPSRAESAIEAVMEQLRQLCEQPVPDAELTKAKEYAKGRLLLSLESTNALAGFLGEEELLTGRVRDVDEVIAAVDAVTPDQLMASARRTFAEHPLRLAMIGPSDDADRIARLINWS